MRARLLLPLLGLLTLTSLAMALLSGSLAVGPVELLHILTGGRGTGMAREVVLDLRLPRTLAAFATGALLAQAGALMQVLLRNPLADPYVLGISGGAATAALVALGVGLGGLALSVSAFAGALIAMILVFGLAHGGGTWSPNRLLLTGVVLAAGWGALISLLLALSPNASLRGMLFWLMGDLSGAAHPATALTVAAAGLVLALPLARELNVLTAGTLQAGALGVNVARLHAAIYLLASLLTAAAVTVAGSIGFVGLVVPHALRLLGVRDHRVLLPGAALLGGALLVLADTLARTVAAPQQLPVGVITAALGVPLFLVLLRRGYR